MMRPLIFMLIVLVVLAVPYLLVERARWIDWSVAGLGVRRVAFEGAP